MDYLRTLDFYDPSNRNDNVLIVGAGHIGSFVAFGLAKLGVKKITIVDPDIVEKHNIPYQFYPESATGYKVHSLKQSIEFMGTDSEIIVIPSKIESADDKVLDKYYSTMFLCPDNMSTRRWCFNNIKTSHIIDVRTGGLYVNIYNIPMTIERAKTYYASKLYGDGEVMPLPCTGRGVIDVSMGASAMAINMFRNSYDPKSYHTFYDFSTGLSWVMFPVVSELETEE